MNDIPSVIQTNTAKNRAVVTAWIRIGLDVWIHEGPNKGTRAWFQVANIGEPLKFKFENYELYSLGKPEAES